MVVLRKRIYEIWCIWRHGYHILTALSLRTEVLAGDMVVWGAPPEEAASSAGMPSIFIGQYGRTEKSSSPTVNSERSES